MSRVETREAIQIKKSGKSSLAKIRTFLEKEKMVILDASITTVTEKQGSQFLTRAIGAWFVPENWLPTKAIFTIKDSEIDILFEETLGFSVFDNIIKEKYEKRFKRIVSRFTDFIK